MMYYIPRFCDMWFCFSLVRLSFLLCATAVQPSFLHLHCFCSSNHDRLYAKLVGDHAGFYALHHPKRKNLSPYTCTCEGFIIFSQGRRGQQQQYMYLCLLVIIINFQRGGQIKIKGGKYPPPTSKTLHVVKHSVCTIGRWKTHN